MTKYPMEINATTLVYLRESKRRKNDKGITISLNGQSARRKEYFSTRYSHESSHPKASINQKSKASRVFVEASHYSRH